MRRRAAVIALALAVCLGGCGFYAIRFEPPAPPGPAGRRPLDLSLGLGEVSAYTHGEPVALDPEALGELDADFVRAVRAAGVVRAALSRGTPTDLRFDTVRRLHLGMTATDRRAYQIFALPVAMAIPGVPYPWDLHVERTSRLWGRIRGQQVLVWESRVRYAVVAWGKGYWAVLLDDPLRRAEVDYVVAGLGEAVDRDHPRFARIEAAIRDGNLDALRRLAVDPLPEP